MTRDTKAQPNPSSHFLQNLLAFCIKSVIDCLIKTPKPENPGFCCLPSISTAFFQVCFLSQWHMYSPFPCTSCYCLFPILLDIMKVSWPFFFSVISCFFTLIILLDKNHSHSPPLKNPKCPRTRPLDFQIFSKTKDSSVITCHPLQTARSSGYNPHSCCLFVRFGSTSHLIQDH